MFLSESKHESEDIMVFLKNRKNGAKDSASAAKEKGGDAMLSYYHFAAKDKPYAEVIKVLKQDGLKNAIKLCKQSYKNLIANLDLDMSQKDYQRIVGEIEVFGECYIRLQKEI